MSPRCFSPPILFLLAGLIAAASAQTDDSTDGDDNGWTRFDPIGQTTGSPYALYQIQFGQYRLNCDPPPNPAMAGPARVSS